MSYSLPNYLRLWHWLSAVVVALFWTDAMSQWVHSAAQFGWGMLFAYPVIFVVFVSPLFVIPSAWMTVRRYRSGSIDWPTFLWRLSWVVAMLINSACAVLWANGAFE